MLRWAREWRGRSLEEAAKKVSKKSEDIANWEDANHPTSPTVNQARILADYYDRPFMEFFLPEPPNVPAPRATVDFRIYTGRTPPEPSWELTEARRWAESARINALDLYTDLEEQPSSIPESIFCSVSDNPEVAASNARAAMSFAISDQTALDSSNGNALTAMLRTKLEKFGVMVLRHSGLKGLGVRGICIAEYPLPVIVFTNEPPSGQAFTLAHEFGHVLLKAGGISGGRTAQYESQPVEKWCDRFAAAFLMPVALISVVAGEKPNSPQASIKDVQLEQIAKALRISPHATLIRLVYLGYVRSEYYWNVKKPEFDATDASYVSPPTPRKQSV